MKILCFTPYNPDLKTPETSNTFLLAKRGHKIMLVHTKNEFDDLKIDEKIVNFNPDVIFSMMEYSLPIATAYANLMKKPIYAHIECIPPWRTGLENGKDYGLDTLENERDCNQDITKVYNIILDMFQRTNFRTISEESWRYSFEKYNGKKLDAEVKYYTYDLEPLKNYEFKHPQKYQIYTIARLVPTKRIHHIIKALGMIDKSIRPKYAVIGYGPMKNYLKFLAEKKDVDIEFYGNGKYGIKEKVIQESMFGVEIFSGIPIIEGAYYKKPSVIYKTPQTEEVFSDSVVYCNNNDINDLKEKIEMLLKDRKKIEELGEKANYLIFNNKTNILDNETYVKNIERYLNKAIENFNKK